MHKPTVEKSYDVRVGYEAGERYAAPYLSACANHAAMAALVTYITVTPELRETELTGADLYEVFGGMLQDPSERRRYNLTSQRTWADANFVPYGAFDRRVRHDGVPVYRLTEAGAAGLPLNGLTMSLREDFRTGIPLLGRTQRVDGGVNPLQIKLDALKYVHNTWQPCMYTYEKFMEATGTTQKPAVVSILRTLGRSGLLYFGEAQKGEAVYDVNTEVLRTMQNPKKHPVREALLAYAGSNVQFNRADAEAFVREQVSGANANRQLSVHVARILERLEKAGALERISGRTQSGRLHITRSNIQRQIHARLLKGVAAFESGKPAFTKKYSAFATEIVGDKTRMSALLKPDDQPDVLNGAKGSDESAVMVLSVILGLERPVTCAELQQKLPARANGRPYSESTVRDRLGELEKKRIIRVYNDGATVRYSYE